MGLGTLFAPGAFLAWIVSFRKASLWHLLAFWFISGARAQYVIDSWTTENGLPQNSVKSIQQTPDGYLWFTTSDGLVRFDGVRFTVFNKGNSPELTTNRFLDLLADKDGTLWISTESQDLIRYRDGHFLRFKSAGFHFQRDIDGSLLIQISEGTQHLRDGQLIQDPQPESGPVNIHISPRGARWDLYRTRADLHRNWLRLTMKGHQTSYELPPFPVMDAQMDETPDEALWLAASGNLYRLKEGRFTVYRAQEGMPQSQIMAMSHDREGHIWLATMKDGVCRFADGRIACYKSADGLSSDYAVSVFQDREGTIWVGTNNRGLNRLNRRAVTPFSAAAGLPDTAVYGILEDRAGDVWLGTGPIVTRMRDRRVIQSLTRADGWLYGGIQGLYEDRLGRLWIGGTGGVQYYANGRFTDFTANLKMPPAGYLFIHEDAAGALWFGTDQGLLRYQSGQVRRYTVADGLPSDDVKVAHWARDGTFWVGTHGGLARLDGARFVAYTERDGLASNHVRALHEDEQGTLWIGTYDGGLSRLRNGAFFNYTTTNGLFSNGAFAILDDARGNFWMSSNQGIYRVSRRQLEDVASRRIPAVMSTAFGKSDGMLNSECNGGKQPPAVRTRDGKLWFPTQDGVAVIDPEAISYNALPPPVVIESAQVQGRNLPLAGGLRLNPKDANLEIRYTGLSLVKPEQVRFRYRLEALDVGWVDAGTRRAAFYPYLPPGRYVFRVSAANSDLVWNEQGAALAIVVLPPFYRTWWFLSLACLSAVGAAGFTWKRRVTQLERAQALQQAFSRQLIGSQEGERKRMAAELHDSLGQQLLIIKNRADLGVRVAGDPGRTKEQFNEITTSASQAIDEVREIAYNLRPPNLERLGVTAVIEELIEKVSAASGIQFSADIAPLDGWLPPDDAINLYRIIQESINNIIRHAQASKANVEIWDEGGGLHITVADNGSGFTLESPARRGLGLTSIAERVKMLGGVHTIVSTPGHGTTLTIHLPTRRVKGAGNGA